MMKNKKGKFKKFLLILSILITFLFLSLSFCVIIIYNKYDLNTQKLTSLNNGIKVYSATGGDNTMYNTNRSIIEIETLPKHVKNAFISIEDKRFYSHSGYDVKRILKSLLVNFSNQSKSQGASTISQQLVKNALLSNEKTYSRKIEEIILSIKMEKKFSKDEILEMYLNTIYFGSNAYGIENASNVYFNKSAKDLTLNEACVLAGLIKSPKSYSPKLNYDNAINRKNLVAKRMFEIGYINKSEYEEVLSSKVEVCEEKYEDNSYEQEAIFEACSLLNLTEREIINRKYQIITFKDDKLQEEVIKSNNNIISSAEESTNSSLDSLSIVSNNSGHVLAYYENSNYNLHNIKRQPASLLKPLAVYLPCFQHNILSPSSMILDEEINFSGFTPKNADGLFHGYVSVRNALSNSLNIPAVKSLDYLGVKKAKECLESLGINITNADKNLSLALGAVKNGVSLIELFNAYVAIANKGNYNKLCFVNKILDENNNVIYQHETYSTKVANEDDCFLLSDILKDASTTGTAKKLASLNLPVASKTGTASNNMGNTDLFNIAYTTEHSMITWVADIDKNILSSTLLSSSQPTVINKDILAYLYENHIPNDFIKPANVEKHAYDLVELNNSHILVSPNHNIERYIAYDYFKNENAPQIKASDEFDFDISIDKYGVTIHLNTKKYLNYNIFKKTKQETKLLKTITDLSGDNIILDKDVFAYDEIEYYITNNNGEILGKNKKVRPKDYLINILNNELLSSKKKWLV